ncbi:MAG: NADH:flavin oxidoreductase [Fusobacteriaceae bacterium]|nr:NADH:flavin oxidoreductase [Fusobacteriaceae bacterium]
MKNLFEESFIGNMKIKNRFIRSATWESLATEQGYLTKELLEVYKRLSESEIGLIITGYANIVEEEKPNKGMMGIYNDDFISDYKILVETVHNNDCKIVMQLAYGGTKTTYNVGERVIFSPSNIPELTTNTQGKEMSKEDIEYIIKSFGQAANRAKKIGFDGIEIHGAHSYLINQFLSPYYNKRNDEYGGSLENRMRFLKDIYFEIRKHVGDDYPILVKLTACDFIDNGLNFKETRIICKELEKIGVDAIEISGNIHGKAHQLEGKEYEGYKIEKEGYFLDFAKIISNEIDIPVITVGGFRNINKIKEVLENTNICYFALSRPLLAEYDLIKKWKEGKTKTSLCISCSKCRTNKGNYCIVFSKPNPS